MRTTWVRSEGERRESKRRAHALFLWPMWLRVLPFLCVFVHVSLSLSLCLSLASLLVYPASVYSLLSLPAASLLICDHTFCHRDPSNTTCFRSLLLDIQLNDLRATSTENPRAQLQNMFKIDMYVISAMFRSCASLLCREAGQKLPK